MEEKVITEIYRTKYSCMELSYIIKCSDDIFTYPVNPFLYLVDEFKGYIELIEPRIRFNTLRRQIHILAELIESSVYNYNFVLFLKNEIKGREKERYCQYGY